MKLFEEFNTQIDQQKTLFKFKYKDEHLKTYLNQLKFDELNRIVELIAINSTNLNKSKKIELITEHHTKLISHFISHINENHLNIVQLLLKNNGQIEYKSEYVGYLLLFQSYGIAFPIRIGSKPHIVMPIEIRKAFENNLPDTKVIKRNQQISLYIRGLIHLYGLIDIKTTLEKLQDFMDSKIDRSMIEPILVFDIFIQSLYTIKNDYIVSSFIISEMNQYLEKQETLDIDYYPFSHEKILEANDFDQLASDYTINHLIMNTHFNYDAAKEIMLTYHYMLRDDLNYKQLNMLLKQIYHFQNPGAIKNELSNIFKLNKMVRKWSLKGHTYSELNLKDEILDELIGNLDL